MSGPVWRFDAQLQGPCSECLRPSAGLFVEGEVETNTHKPGRLVCADCLRRACALVVAREAGKHTPSPAYARGM